jgi:GT2 family glycosyltransferase
MEIFHGHRQADQNGLAVAALERALQTPEYYPEALIWKGIDALPKDPKQAFVFFNGAASALPLRADVCALSGRSILAQGEGALASHYLTSAWQKLPNDPALRMMLWQARAQSMSPEKLRSIILAHLPDITAPNELAFVLKLLAAQEDGTKTIGVVDYLPEKQEIQGWAINLRDVKNPVTLKIEANGHAICMTANAPHPLLSAAGLPATHGGVRIKVPKALPAVNVTFENGHMLLGSPVFAMPAFIPPHPQGNRAEKQPVDVLIPVYDGLEETLECIDSALAARKLNRTPHRIVVIEDSTPVPALRKALKVLAAKGRITLVQNPVNLGFIRSMNRAMALSPKQDVVWLNADTRVTGNWLDRLRQVAYSDQTIASVTPFTNNGELMSFPESRLSHPMPGADDQRQLDELARVTDSPPMEIETGCGFCLYIKRKALDEVGYLDEVELLRGYGEETDWCLRARAAGWHHVGAPNVFVAHKGGISFGEEKAMRVAHNNAILRRRYPDASARYDAFCLRDPIKSARQALQRKRLPQLVDWIAKGAASADAESVTKQLVVERQQSLTERSQTDAPLRLLWRHENSRTRVTLHARMEPLAFSLDYELPTDNQSLFDDLGNLPLDQLAFKQLTGCPDQLLDLPSTLDKPYRVICTDDQLLHKNGPRNWLAFAQHARSIELPWEALRARYAEALPGARLTTKVGKKACAGHSNTLSTLLIADALTSSTANEWLSLARHITRQDMNVTLLILDDSPWRKALMATGSVRALPITEGFTLAQCLHLTGCDGAVSLDTNPGADWRAAQLANSAGLPLYAVPTPVAVEAGASPLSLLPFVASQA